MESTVMMDQAEAFMDEFFEMPASRLRILLEALHEPAPDDGSDIGERFAAENELGK